MGQRPFSQLSKSKQYAVLYRDTKRLRHFIESELGYQISDEEWLRMLPIMVGETTKQIRMRRRPSLQQQLEALAANGHY